MFETRLPVPKSTDPEFVFENAAFYALAHPPSRMVLQLLAVEPRSALDLLHYFDLSLGSLKTILSDLVAVGFVTKSTAGKETLYGLGGDGVNRVQAYLRHLPGFSGG